MRAASKTPYASPSPRTVSRSVTTVTAVVTAITMSASGAAPTPLYHQYQEHFLLTPFMITIIFATYVLCLLFALLTVGSLSDYVGRRPSILAALALNVAAMIVFMTAGSAAALIGARAIQGFATGLALTTLAATILDTDNERAPLLNSITVFVGLSVGTLGAGALVTFAPAPDQLVFAVLLLLSLVEALILWFMPETATTKPTCPKYSEAMRLCLRPRSSQYRHVRSSNASLPQRVMRETPAMPYTININDVSRTVDVDGEWPTRRTVR
jgi:MFS family permease